MPEAEGWLNKTSGGWAGGPRAPNGGLFLPMAGSVQINSCRDASFLPSPRGARGAAACCRSWSQVASQRLTVYWAGASEQQKSSECRCLEGALTWLATHSPGEGERERERSAGLKMP